MSKSLTPSEMAKLPSCKYDWDIRHKCLFEHEPNLTDCVDCMFKGLFDSLATEKLADAQHCLELFRALLHGCEVKEK